MDELNINYDEAKVPNYKLPELLTLQDGTKTSKTNWQQRRTELLELFTQNVYGKVPDKTYTLEFHISSLNKSALNGKATRKEVAIQIKTDQGQADLNILIYLPNHIQTPVPAFLALNFNGNQSIHTDKEITPSIWKQEKPEHDRGASASRWPVETILEQGYALVTMHCADTDADNDMKNSIHPLFFESTQIKRAHNDWGAISAWAWGLSRMMDYLETDDAIKHTQVALLGHSRLGKAALWSAAQDERYALIISNNSGCAGAALSRRCYGETIHAINTRFPTWFCEEFKQFDNNEAALPIDQHMLLALIAPRPLYVASAQEDAWADPKGEFLAAQHASEAYKALGMTGLEPNSMPDINALHVNNTLAYHIRSGKHDVTAFDWEAYLTFANRQFKLSPT